MKEFSRPLTQVENREFRRKSLLEASVRTVAQQGVEGATIAKICAEAGASRGMSAHYFSSKEDLLAACLSKMFSDALDIKRQIGADTASDPLTLIHRCAAASFQPPGFDTDVLAAWQAFTSASRYTERYREIIQDNNRQMMAFYLQLFGHSGIKSNLRLPAKQATLGLLALLDGLWSNIALNKNELSTDDATQACKSYIQGCFNS
ncbi:TetR/AcrR family transcriptional regulator [Aliamphritea ceti]|uniref:TetR/AcrR family transcriptional regulator n=1 Tax=Aliamphritea ceti TaxID=1524258 RepID=UPI0021C346D2|nr:TetR family transcriptional regulator C-terminal domain-containing protein [Aliamphritea ceti]